jgi:hypothetical protein
MRRRQKDWRSEERPDRDSTGNRCASLGVKRLLLVFVTSRAPVWTAVSSIAMLLLIRFAESWTDLDLLLKVTKVV